jgi:phosphoribosylformylglycinamidine synthase
MTTKMNDAAARVAEPPLNFEQFSRIQGLAVPAGSQRDLSAMWRALRRAFQAGILGPERPCSALAARPGDVVLRLGPDPRLRPASKAGELGCELLLATRAVTGLELWDGAGLVRLACGPSLQVAAGLELELAGTPMVEPASVPLPAAAAAPPGDYALVVRKWGEPAVRQLCERWNLNCTSVGEVTALSKLALRHQGMAVLDTSLECAGDGEPSGSAKTTEGAGANGSSTFQLEGVPDVQDVNAALPAVLAAGQDDLALESPAAFLLEAARLEARGRVDPVQAGRQALAAAARRLASSGALILGGGVSFPAQGEAGPEPLERESLWLRGVTEGCAALGIPLLNSMPGSPTEVGAAPRVIVAGHLERPEHRITSWFKAEGDAVILLGDLLEAADPLRGLGDSVYLRRLLGREEGIAPPVNFEREAELALVLRGLIHAGLIRSAQSCGAGGLAAALAQGCSGAPGQPAGTGAQLDLSGLNPPPGGENRVDAILFGERPARVVISTGPLDAVKVVERAKLLGISALQLGIAGGAHLSLQTPTGTWNWDVTALSRSWNKNAGSAPVAMG